jgi:hypothetical protein
MIALINNDIVRNSDIFQDFIQITKPPGFDEQYEYDRSKILRYHQNLIY